MFAYNIQKSSATQCTEKSVLQANSCYYRYTNNLGNEFTKFFSQLHPYLHKLEAAITDPFCELNAIGESCVYQGNAMSDLLSVADLYILVDQDFRANLILDEVSALVANTKLFLTSVQGVIRANSEAIDTIQTILEFFEKLDALRKNILESFSKAEDSSDNAFEDNCLEVLLNRAVKLMMKFQRVIIKLRNVELFFAISEEQLGKLVEKTRESQSLYLTFEDIAELMKELEAGLFCIENEIEAVTNSLFEEEAQAKVSL